MVHTMETRAAPALLRRADVKEQSMQVLRGFVSGLIVGLLILPILGYVYLYRGHVPVAVTDPAFPREREIVHVPLNARIEREMPHTTPIEASANNLLLGAQVYREQCASCHGLYGHDSSFAAHMYPSAPQLWAPHGGGVVGVSDDPPGETYWKVKNGIRLSGMPAYARVLNEAQMWQVSVLLAHADKPMPPEVMTLLKQPFSQAMSTAAPGGRAGMPSVETRLPSTALLPPPAE